MIEQYSKLFWCLHDYLLNTHDDHALVKEAMIEIVNSWTSYISCSIADISENDLRDYHNVLQVVKHF